LKLCENTKHEKCITVIRGIIDQRGNIDRNDSSRKKFVSSFIDEIFPKHELRFFFLYSWANEN